jgi:ribosomal protein S18 acetylase RimI-like enzyme
MNIRLAETRDVSDLVAVVTRSITELCTSEYQGDPAVLARWLANKTVANFARWVDDERHIVFVAEEGGRVAGVGMLTRDGEVQLDYVSPDFRFRGVSKALLSAMEAEARALGLAEMWLGATQLATEMYASCGWRVTAEVESQFGTLPSRLMRKRLSMNQYAGHLAFVRATPADADRLAAHEQRIASPRLYGQPLDRNACAREIANNVLYFVEVDGALAATAALQRRDDDSAYLSNIAVDPYFRRRGIARAATLFLLQEAKGCARIDLVTHPDNAAAIALYRSLGFEVESSKENYFGDGEPRVVMLKGDRSVV